jgi:hypothetical protein
MRHLDLPIQMAIPFLGLVRVLARRIRLKLKKFLILVSLSLTFFIDLPPLLLPHPLRLRLIFAKIFVEVLILDLRDSRHEEIF